VPDDGVAEPVADWAFGAPARLDAPPAEQEEAWSRLAQAMRAIQVGHEPSAAHVLAATVGRCLDLLALGRSAALRRVAEAPLAAATDNAEWPYPFGSATEPLRALLRDLFRDFPPDSFADRRMLMIGALARWLLAPAEWDLVELAEASGCIMRAGLQLAPAEHQLLLASMYDEICLRTM
jgi:hypothetical protein